jgi:ADP-Ribosyltransferase in polyvalent proteins
MKITDIVSQNPPLPMDEESRMARARQLGFNPDEDWFHGTTGPISQFDPARLGQTTDARNTVLGFFFVDDENMAYSIYAGRRGHVLDALLRLKKPLMLHQPAEFPLHDPGDYLDEYLRHEWLETPRVPTQQDYQEFREYLIRWGYNAIVIVSQFGKIAIMFDAHALGTVFSK